MSSTSLKVFSGIAIVLFAVMPVITDGGRPNSHAAFAQGPGGPGGAGAEMWTFCDENIAANCVAFQDFAICGFANPTCLAINPNEDPVHLCAASVFPMWCDFKAGVVCAGLCQVNGADCSRVDFTKCQ